MYLCRPGPTGAFYKFLSKAPLRGVPATALDLSLVIQKYQKLTSTSIQNEVQKVFQNPRQNGPKCTHVGSKNEAPRGTPSTFGGHFRGF